jgi:DNA-binding HxlR family transcriptional regulator
MIVLSRWIALSNRIVSLKTEEMLTNGNCPKSMLSIKDALEAVEGKWKLLVLFALSSGPKRFKQLSKEVSGITDKTLSKELKNLEANELIKREVHDTFPPTVEYTITAHGMSLEKVLEELHLWGLSHRKKVIGK